MPTVFRTIALTLLILAIPIQMLAQADLQGRWDGGIEVMGQKLDIQVAFKPGEGGAWTGTITIPAQGATDLPLTNVTLKGEKAHFELATPIGLAVFDGTLKGEAIAGSFTQGATQGTFALERAKAAAAPAPAALPEPPPYLVEEVKIANGAVTLAGTLTVPQAAGRHPVAILITGSGPQDRDETLFGFKPFRLIADHLTRQGIAVLRCDDRGVGGSTGAGPAVTTEDFARDVEAQIEFLKTRAEIDAKRVGLIGHSEGGLIAPMVAARSSDVAFVVLLSGPGLAGEQILLLQGERMLKARGAGPDVLAKQAQTQHRLFAVARGKATADEVAKQLNADIEAQAAQLPETQRKSLAEMGRKQVEGQIKSVQSPWFRFFLDYDPAIALVKVRCPVLAVFGELDLQVPVAENKAAMEQAFARSGNRDVSFKVLAGANHLYQHAKTGDATEYPQLKKEFVPELLPELSAWLRQRVGLAARTGQNPARP